MLPDVAQPPSARQINNERTVRDMERTPGNTVIVTDDA
jgi:hypothetical protein